MFPECRDHPAGYVVETAFIIRRFAVERAIGMPTGRDGICYGGTEDSVFIYGPFVGRREGGTVND